MSAVSAGGTTITYTYDVDGTRNIKRVGDVVRMLDSAGTIVASYEYDPFGNIITATGTMAEANPLRYRGYYYDRETGFYYLNSRYYDPKIGRFINADEQFDKKAGIVGYNLYAYCANNPVMYKDDTGNGIILTCILIGAGIGLFAGGGYGAYRAHNKGYSPDDGWDYWKYIVGYGATGGVVGALVGWGAGALIAKYGVLTTATSITKGGGASFSSYDALKRSLGTAGKGRHWHHIVEQCQLKPSRAGFSIYWIQNSNNVINIPIEVHDLISRFYSSIPNPSVVNTGGMVFRDWITNMSFEKQYNWGIWVLRYFGVNV